MADRYGRTSSKFKVPGWAGKVIEEIQLDCLEKQSSKPAVGTVLAYLCADYLPVRKVKNYSIVLTQEESRDIALVTKSAQLAADVLAALKQESARRGRLEGTEPKINTIITWLCYRYKRDPKAKQKLSRKKLIQMEGRQPYEQAEARRQGRTSGA